MRPATPSARVVALLTVTGLGLALPRVAHADDAQPEVVEDARAQRAKDAGDAAMAAGAYPEALAAYHEAYALAPNPALLYNMGRAEERLSQYPEALRDMEQFARSASPELRAKVPNLNALLTDLRSHVAFLSVRSNVPGSKIMLRGHYAATTPLRYSIVTTGGKANLEVTADGYIPYQHEIALEEGHPVSVAVTLVPKSAATAVATSVPPASPARPDPFASVRTHPAAGSSAGADRATSVTTTGADTAVDPTRDRASTSSAPITQKWWFWTGVGVAAMGTVALTAALLTEKSAPRGDVGPGQASAPLLRF